MLLTKVDSLRLPIKRQYSQTKNANNLSIKLLALIIVHLWRFELQSMEPESIILSIEL